jgi:hypothetical protein
MLSVTTVAAQRPPRALPLQARVSVGHAGHDPVGDQVAFALREAVRRSEGYTLVESGPADYSVQFVTVAIECGFGNDVSSAVSVIFFADHGRFLTAYVYSVGSKKARGLGESVLASLDEEIADDKRRTSR